MSLFKRLPSHIAQRVYLFNDNTISNLNRYKPNKYSLNKKRKITCGIKTFIKQTNKEFDIDKINVFRNNSVLHKNV